MIYFVLVLLVLYKANLLLITYLDYFQLYAVFDKHNFQLFGYFQKYKSFFPHKKSLNNNLRWKKNDFALRVYYVHIFGITFLKRFSFICHVGQKEFTL